MSGYQKPLPTLTENSLPFWEATKRHELVAQRCSKCAELWLPPSGVCPKCLSTDLKWEKLSGRGKVWSWVVFYQTFFKSFADDVPYNVTYVELEEGPMLTSSVIGIPNDEIKFGMPLEVVFQEVTPEITLHKFRARG